jgi:hypothetical protein
MSPIRKKPINPDDESDFYGDPDYEECSVCHQEFRDGFCPINSADCPYCEDEEDDFEEDDEPDFEDVEDLDEILGDDEEADRLTEEEEDFSDEDFAEEDDEEYGR